MNFDWTKAWKVLDQLGNLQKKLDSQFVTVLKTDNDEDSERELEKLIDLVNDAMIGEI